MAGPAFLPPFINPATEDASKPLLPSSVGMAVAAIVGKDGPDLAGVTHLRGRRRVKLADLDRHHRGIRLLSALEAGNPDQRV